jgi:hypothetical protein
MQPIISETFPALPSSDNRPLRLTKQELDQWPPFAAEEFCTPSGSEARRVVLLGTSGDSLIVMVEEYTLVAC